MDEKRKEWCEKYDKKIADGGIIDAYCLPKHVKRVLSTYQVGEFLYIGWDGCTKTWNELTEEEKQDYNKQCEQIPNNLNKFVNKKQQKEFEQNER